MEGPVEGVLNQVGLGSEQGFNKTAGKRQGDGENWSTKLGGTASTKAGGYEIVTRLGTNSEGIVEKVDLEWWLGLHLGQL